MERVLMKGNEAIAEGAIRAGCRFYAGYPITPQSEILEYMAKHMPEVGGTFIQGESEVASVSMLWGAAAAGARAMTSSAGPGFSLKQEGISYIASYDIPAVIVSMMRYGIGCGDITAGQDSYLQATKGGGNGDYRLIVLAPNSVDECANLTYEAFDIAEKYRNQVLIAGDGCIGQMVEPVALPEPREKDINEFEYTVKGLARPEGQPHAKATNIDVYIGHDAWSKHVRDRAKAIMENEQRWESYEVDDAELIFVAFGISSRVCKEAVREARAQGIKLGLIRPITLWPYPRKAFENLPDSLKCLMVVEMDICAQMKEDVRLATKFKYPIYDYCTAVNIPTATNVLAMAKKALAGELTEMEEL